MARLFDDTQLEYLTIPTPVMELPPLAMCCWFNSDDAAAAGVLMSICDESVNNSLIAMYQYDNGINNREVAIHMIQPGGAWQIAKTTAGHTAGNWHHACGMSVNATDRRVLLDGGNKGTNATSCFPVGLDNTSIGLIKRATPAGYMSGAIAEVCIYQLGLLPGITFSDKADYFESNVLPSLAAGFSPLFYPYGLMAYYHLMDVNGSGEDTDIVGGYDMTPVNTPSFTDHPRVIMPTRAQFIIPKSILLSYGKLNSVALITSKLEGTPCITDKLNTKSLLTGNLNSYN